ncbi:hypothetical protein L211DRAFT_788763 [Terfezia boudieri ATCC MYA-4762]|uniref:GYF domain-containing protein n=1 Tax=Terfezia boudieri ATCC MYA-4762 TaxID=1051890 RepID=A0A3N4LHK8_9PEZI|nr:hypothetical protein L211DRAFT_788763 [Terfezia boudieri ATCC MYA-4762]
MSRPILNPKRGPTYSPPTKSARLPSYINQNQNQNQHQHQHKKPKFDPRNPSTLLAEDTRSGDVLDDSVLDLDEIGAGERRLKRGAIRIEGYDSDSSNEGYERKVESEGKKRKSGKGGVDNDDDMFGGDGGGDEDGVATGNIAPKKRKNEVRFLQLEEIEGQESDNDAEHVHISQSGGKGKGREGDTSESGSDDEDAEANVAEDVSRLDPELGLGSLKKHAPKLEAFNMRGEMEEGRFDANGNFVRNAADADAVHDSWLEGVSRKEMKKAKEAHEKREEEMRRKARAEDELLTSDMLSTLIMGMETGETVLEALARLGQERKKKVAQAEKEAGVKTAHHLTTAEEQVQKVDKHYKELIEKLTGAADSLLTRGQLEIYDDSREMLMRQYRRETGEAWSLPIGAQRSPRGEVQWEYRWTDGRDGGSVYGPFPGKDMKTWNQHGFFGEGVEFRKVGSDVAWTLVADFD